ncbi:MAG: hypothetical protein NTW14_06170 [bacterium]|nr:hypothetical protein [bacterium]
MSSILDLVGSFIIGGLLLMMILSFNANVSEMSTQDQLELIVQQNMTELVSEIEFDFRKIGYRVPNPALAVISADTSGISFRGDIDDDGTVDVLTYQLGTTGEMRGTHNPRDRIIRRTVNGQTTTGSLGVTGLRLRYYDLGGTATTNVTLIKTIEYRLSLESPFPIDTTYARATWNGIIRPKNL